LLRNDYRNLPILEDKIRDIHIRILKGIHEDNSVNLNKLSKSLERAPSTISYHLYRLQNSGYLIIRNDGFNCFYELTEKGVSYLWGVSKKFKMLDRAHDILFKFPITRTPRNGFLEDGFISNSRLSDSAKQLTRRGINRVVIQINPRSITINIAQVRGEDPQTCIMTAFKIAESEIIELIRKNPGLVVGTEVSGVTYLTQIGRQSHAIPMDPYAVVCNKFGVVFRGKNVEVDKSHGIPEIEFTNPRIGDLHFQRYKDVTDAIIDGRLDIFQIQKDVEILKRRYSDVKNV